MMVSLPSLQAMLSLWATVTFTREHYKSDLWDHFEASPFNVHLNVRAAARVECEADRTAGSCKWTGRALALLMYI